MAKFYVEYSGYVEVEAKDEEEAVMRAIDDGLLNLDMDAYTPRQWQKHKKLIKARYDYENTVRNHY